MLAFTKTSLLFVLVILVGIPLASCAIETMPRAIQEDKHTLDEPSSNVVPINSSTPPAPEVIPHPPNQPELGLIYDGMELSLEGPCTGLYKLVKTGLCTHGPDLAPPGINIKENVPPISPISKLNPVIPSVLQFVPFKANISVPNTLSEVKPKLVTSLNPAQAPLHQIKCEGNGIDGNRVQVIYAHAKDVKDRYDDFLPSFRQWAADVDTMFSASAAETGGIRHVRFVTDANAPCSLAIPNIVLTETGDDNIDNTIAELQGIHGFNRLDRKYMIFVDANIICGQGTLNADDRVHNSNRNNYGPSYGRIDAGCWGGDVAAHELMHNLGAVQRSAPHSSNLQNSNDTNTWHCFDEWDRLCYSDAEGVVMTTACSDRFHEHRFDCNHDDYYNTNPTAGSYLSNHWNTANNQFLIGPPGYWVIDFASNTFGDWNTIFYDYGRADAHPVPADYDGDGTADLSVKVDDGRWLIDFAKDGFGTWNLTLSEYGGANAHPVPADYDGDGTADLSVKVDDGRWLIDFAKDGFGTWNLTLSEYGGADAHPVPADYDGDGTADLSVKVDDGRWLIDFAKDGFGTWNLTLSEYGGADAYPVPADYDGDGTADLSVKVDDGRWLIDFAKDGFGTWNLTLSEYGGADAHPVPADYDGDGTADLSVKVDDGRWLIDFAKDGFGTWNLTLSEYGGADAHPVPADYDGDGTADLSVKVDN